MIEIFPPGVRQRLRIDREDKSVWQRFRRNASLSVLGSGFSVAIRLGQTVLMTRFLKIDDYGRVLIVLNLFTFLDSFLGLRVSDVIFRFFQPLREQGDTRAVRSLLLFCLGISLSSGVLVYAGILIASPWLAAHMYSNSGLAALFILYGWTVLLSAFSGFYEPILRIHDRFSSLIVPQVMGNLITLAILCGYFATAKDGHDLKVVVAAFAAGVLVQTLPPLVKALRLVRPFLTQTAALAGGASLLNYRRDLIRCLLNSNLSGYLKFAISPGDIFLLGLFSSPAQVALYGLARQLASPLALLQATIQTAIAPEITALIAKQKLQQLQRLTARYVLAAAAGGGLLLLAALVAGRLLLLHFFDPQYLRALPVFYCLVVAAWLLLVFLVFRPLAVSLDLLRWHNLALLVSTLIILVLIIEGSLTALTTAYVQLAEASILRLAFALLVWMKLRAMIPSDSAA